MSPKEFAQAISPLAKLSEKQQQQFADYYQILVLENQKTNLTRITEESDVYLKHFYDSLVPLIAGVDIPSGSRLADIGAGAGFPSFTWKIIRPDIELTIIESSQKRLDFLAKLIDKLGFDNVELIHQRVEDAGNDARFRNGFDLVTARAVANMPVLLEYTTPLLKQNGRLIALKGSNGKAELASSTNSLEKLKATVTNEFAVELPESAGDRIIFEITKTGPTPAKYPRKAGLPNKKPL